MMSNWFHVLRNIDDKTLFRINGADYTMYIVFIRYAASLTIGLSVFALVVLFPFYLTGEMNTKYITPFVEDRLDHATVLNVTTSVNNWKL
jgi:uncharacterized sodium:solute symporter family permease YidK